MQQENARVIKDASKLFLFLLVLIGSILGGAAAILHHTAKNDYLAELKAREARVIGMENAAIQAEFDALASNVLFLAGQNELIRYLDTGDERLLGAIREEYLRLANTNESYDQVRFLNKAGMEKVRVNRESGPAVAIPKARLQDKGKRYYFTDCFALGKDSVYVSPLDLNVENGIVEFPLKPMIRVGSPVFDSRENKKGVVLVNYKASMLLDRIAESGEGSRGEQMLLNPDGYWLLGPNSDRIWGFMFKDLADDTFAQEYPEEWAAIRRMKTGQIMTGNGLFSFLTLRPLGDRYQDKTALPQDARPCNIDAQDYFWVLLTRVPPEVMQAHANGFLFKLGTWGGGLFLFIMGGAGHLSIAITRRRAYQAQLVQWALYDALTGLANRKLFFDHLAADLAHAERHERRLALLYIDLDGFKAVNDTHGHKAGDDLLVQVGERLTGILRKSDTVARLGGDEFAVILTEADEEAAIRVGGKIIEELGRPFSLSAVDVTIGASVGVAVYPDHENSQEALIKSADQAMYESKARGKNSCTSAGSLDC